MRLKARHAIILTESYPFVGGDDFLQDEIPAWLEAFEHVTLLPAHEGKEAFPLLPGAEVDNFLCRKDFPRHRAFWVVRALFTGLPYILSEVLPLVRSRKLSALTPTIKGYARWTRARIGIRRLLRRKHADVIYCYWMNAESFAAASLRLSGQCPPTISRAHGIDLYEQRWLAQHMPLRDRFYGGFDLVLPVSDAGHKHLSLTYPSFAHRLEVHRLGVRLPEVLTRPSPVGELHVMTIASCVPVKRLDRVPLALEDLRRALPNVKLRWTHVGGGPGLDELRALADSEIDSTVQFHFTGRVYPHEVMSLLASQEIDVLLNVSETEGIPVALMEGMARGIPAVAPSVGGIPELVLSEENGWLLPARPEPSAIAAVLQRAFTEAKLPDVRLAARERIQRKFSATTNYSRLARRAASLAAADG